MKKYVTLMKWGVLVILILTTWALYTSNRALRVELSNASNNEKAYIAERDNLLNNNREFKLSIEQLSYYNDSIISKLVETKNSLKIKNEDLKYLQYQLSKANKVDTIHLKDTIFKDSTVKIDTTIGNKWYNINLKLNYPSTIITSPTFISEKQVFMNYKKETINPPKRFFLCRWFQKKQEVVEVHIKESSPYIENKESKFIEIIK